MPLLELRNVTKTYRAPDGGDAVEVLRAVNWQLSAGASAAIVGPSGSGKSTVLNLIGALDRPDAGTVLVDGNDVGKLGEQALAAYRNTEIGFIFQMHHLLPQCTILENVLVPTLARPKADRVDARTRAESLIDAVGLANRRNHRPGELSGGERQRAAVARALINRPKLLLADEPTGALDRVNAGRLADLLVQIHRDQGVALVLVTHAPDLAVRMENVLELRDGQLVPRPPQP